MTHSTPESRKKLSEQTLVNSATRIVWVDEFGNELTYATFPKSALVSVKYGILAQCVDGVNRQFGDTAAHTVKLSR